MTEFMAGVISVVAGLVVGAMLVLIVADALDRASQRRGSRISQPEPGVFEWHTSVTEFPRNGNRNTAWTNERDKVVLELRELCADFGSNDWQPEDDLGDVIHNHLALPLYKASDEQIEKERREQA